MEVVLTTKAILYHLDARDDDTVRVASIFADENAVGDESKC
jgi:hypothetical protein